MKDTICHVSEASEKGQAGVAAINYQHA